jgi:hypothetical protein
MDKVKQNMIRKAQAQHKSIYPCGARGSISDCFTTHGNKIYFWYNTKDRSTHLIVANKSRA